MNETGRISTVRLYGSMIAIVSGAYSVYLSTAGAGPSAMATEMAMTAGGWFMLALGVIVIAHGVVLLTPAFARLGTASGPLMIGYSVLMLLNQGWPAADGMTADDMDEGGMSNGMDSGTLGTTEQVGEMMAMGPDAGMVAIAGLMLASGLVMTARRGMVAAEG